MRKAVLAVAACAAVAWTNIGAAQPSANLDMPDLARTAPVVEGQIIVSSDGREVGRVASVDRAEDGSVSSIRAEIEGFLGLGTGMVTMSPDEFQVDGERVVLAKTAEEVRGVPSPSHESFDRQ